MHWVIQNNMFNEEGFRILLDALDKMDYEYSIHKVIPFSHELTPDFNPDAEKVIVMGGYTLANIAQAKGWTPGSFMENLNFKVQYCHWGDEMLNCDAKVSKLADAEPFETPKFLRPTGDGKAFNGQIMDWYEFDHWRDRTLAINSWSQVTGDTEIMVSPLKKIYREIRNWVINGEVVTSSGYLMGGRVHGFEPDQDELDYAQKIADIWSPNEAYCLDVADTEEGLKVLEVNNLNSSGFYGADMQKLVWALEEAFG